MAFGYCPDCVARIEVGSKPKKRQSVVCPCCDTRLRVTNLNPLQLDWIGEQTVVTGEEEWEVELERV